MTAIFQLADAYVERLCSLDPFVAAMYGVDGHDDDLTDYSPNGIEARIEHARRTAARLRGMEAAGRADRVCRDFMRERLQVELDSHDAGESWRMLRNIASPVQTIRQTFDLAKKDSEEDWIHIRNRLARVPVALAQFREGLTYGLAHGVSAPERQAVLCAKQASTWAGMEGDGTPYFSALVAACPVQGPLRRDLESAAALATEAYGDLATYLRTRYAPVSTQREPVGVDRYAIAARQWLGTTIDFGQAYSWAWDELHRIEAEMERVAEVITPGEGIHAALDTLRHDPARTINGADNLLQFLQERTDRAVDDLDGVHFDIPPAIRRCECRLAPTGGAAAMYYTPPSEDLTRPGRMWYPTMGRTEFPIWFEVTTAYHEGVPGHHLQFGMLHCLKDELSRFQRTVGWVSGNGEGWALYAERLMDDLGFLEKPDYRMGMLVGQAFRAVRVILDIGLHLELSIPRGEANAGARWDWALALDFATRYSPYPGAFTESEVQRYLGMPAQAISYKIGEREWLRIRNECQTREGPAFDLKAFHARALRVGPIGLGQLADELTTAPHPN